MGPAPRLAGQRYHRPQARPGLSELARMTSRSPGWRLPPPRRPRLAGPPARRPPPPPTTWMPCTMQSFSASLSTTDAMPLTAGRAPRSRNSASGAPRAAATGNGRRYSGEGRADPAPAHCPARTRPRRESPWVPSAAAPLAERVAGVGVSPFSQTKQGVTAVKLPTEGFHREQARRSECPRSAPRPEKRLLQEADAPGRPKGQCPALCLPCAKVKAPEGGCRNTPVLGKGSRSDEEEE